MARYTGPRCRLCRREGIKLYLKGERCYTEKCALSRKSFPPGQNMPSRRKVTEYGIQLREKQKVRRVYGVLENQFRNYFHKAERQSGVTGDNLFSILERRFDNVIYRIGLGSSRTEARQLIRHGHFAINGKKVDIPSYLLKAGDVIEVREKSKSKTRLKENIETAGERTVPEWLEYDAERAVGRVVSLPSRDHVDIPIEDALVIELYSR